MVQACQDDLLRRIRECRLRQKFLRALRFQKGFEGGEQDANPAPEGIVVIFGSADGGIAGATLAEIQRMVKGEVSREAFWTQSYLDPVEAFRAAHP